MALHSADCVHTVVVGIVNCNVRIRANVFATFKIITVWFRDSTDNYRLAFGTLQDFIGECLHFVAVPGTCGITSYSSKLIPEIHR